MPADGYLDYIELPGADIPATKKFYGSVFGWSFIDYGPDYVAFDSAGRQGGFNAERKVVATGGPLIVLYAADLDSMEAKVKAAGAESSRAKPSKAAAVSTSAIRTATKSLSGRKSTGRDSFTPGIGDGASVRPPRCRADMAARTAVAEIDDQPDNAPDGKTRIAISGNFA